MVNSRLIHRMVDRWCRRTYRAAARIVVLSPGFKAKLVERGVSAEKIEVVYNWSDDDPPASSDCLGDELLGPRAERQVDPLPGPEKVRDDREARARETADRAH